MSTHPLVKYLDGRQRCRRSSRELAQLLYEQAALAEGTQLPNPPEYVQRLNRLLVRLAGTPAASPRTCVQRRRAPSASASPVPPGTRRRSSRPRRPRQDTAAPRAAPSRSCAIRIRSSAAPGQQGGVHRGAAFQQFASPAIRFNFRGVGASARQLRRGTRGDRGCARGDRLRPRALAAGGAVARRASPSAARWRCAPPRTRRPRAPGARWPRRVARST